MLATTLAVHETVYTVSAVNVEVLPCLMRLVVSGPWLVGMLS